MNSKYKRYKNRIKRHEDKRQLVNEYEKIVVGETDDISTNEELNNSSGIVYEEKRI